MNLKEQFMVENGYMNKFDLPEFNTGHIRTVNIPNELLNEYIEWLENRVPQWISVNERLPERFSRVLVTDGKEVTQAYIGHVKDTFHGQFLLNEEWLDKPTHWAELPFPPILKRGTDAEP